MYKLFFIKPTQYLPINPKYYKTFSVNFIVYIVLFGTCSVHVVYIRLFWRSSKQCWQREQQNFPVNVSLYFGLIDNIISTSDGYQPVSILWQYLLWSFTYRDTKSNRLLPKIDVLKKDSIYVFWNGVVASLQYLSQFLQKNFFKHNLYEKY